MTSTQAIIQELPKAFLVHIRTMLSRSQATSQEYVYKGGVTPVVVMSPLDMLFHQRRSLIMYR